MPMEIKSNWIHFTTRFDTKLRLNKKVLATTFLQLGELVTSGLPLKAAIELILNTGNKDVKAFLQEVYDGIVRGDSFTESLAPYQNSIGIVNYKQLVAGEKSGNFEKILVSVANQIEDAREMHSEFLATLYYPIGLFISLFLLFIVLYKVVVPMLSGVMKNLGEPVTGMTAITINMAYGVNHYGQWMLLGIVGFIVLWKLVISKMFRFQIDRAKLKIPIMGKYLENVCNYSVFTALSNMVENGIPIASALPLCIDTITNTFKVSKFKQAEKLHVVNALTFSEALKESKAIDDYGVQVVSVGTITGTLEDALTRYAGILKKENQQIMRKLSTELYYVFILLAGIMVGFTVISLYTPIFNMGQYVAS